jgi:hypothetical protein
VRRLTNQDAVVEHLDGPRQHETIREHRPLVHRAVVVGVLEHDHASDRRFLGRRHEVRHVARHLDDPHPTLEVPVDCDRILDERLARDELDPIARRHEERGDLFLRRAWRAAVGDRLQTGRPWPVRLRQHRCDTGRAEKEGGDQPRRQARHQSRPSREFSCISASMMGNQLGARENGYRMLARIIHEGQPSARSATLRPAS